MQAPAESFGYRCPEIGGFMRRPVKLSNADKAQTIYRILQSRTNRKNRGGDVSEKFAVELCAKIERYVRQGDPVPMVLIAFPFKMPNPLKTNRTTADMGELAFLRKLRFIDETIRKVHTPGVTWTILTEGGMFHELFGISADEAASYRGSVQHLAEAAFCGGTICFEDIAQLANTEEFPAHYAAQFDALASQVARGEFRAIEECYEMFYWSQNLRGMGLADLRAIYHPSGGEAPESPEQELRRYLREQAAYMAVAYTAFNGARKGTAAAFPDCVHACVIRKAERLALHTGHYRTKRMPHHGVPLARFDEGTLWIDVVPLEELIPRHETPQRTIEGPLVGVYLRDDFERQPFVYVPEAFMTSFLTATGISGEIVGQAASGVGLT